MKDEVVGIVGSAVAYFIIHQYEDENGKYDAEVIEKLTAAKDDEYEDAFDCLEYDLKNHEFEDRYSVVKVESQLVKSYCYDYGCYEFDEELYIEEVDFESVLINKL